MLLGKLQGYDIDTGQYTVGGVVENLPKPAFCVSNTVLPADYDDISSSPEYWDEYSKQFIGTITGFKDWMSLRAIVLPLITAICGVDYANFDLLNAKQKAITLTYFPTKIITAQGFDFFATQSGALQGLKAESMLRANFLDATYIKRGVLWIADDGIEGLGNWTIADNGFVTDGLKALIINGTFVLGGGIPTDTFINALIGIIQDGLY